MLRSLWEQADGPKDEGSRWDWGVPIGQGQKPQQKRDRIQLGFYWFALWPTLPITFFPPAASSPVYSVPNQGHSDPSVLSLLSLPQFSPGIPGFPTTLISVQSTCHTTSDPPPYPQDERDPLGTLSTPFQISSSHSPFPAHSTTSGLPFTNTTTPNPTLSLGQFVLFFQFHVHLRALSIVINLIWGVHLFPNFPFPLQSVNFQRTVTIFYLCYHQLLISTSPVFQLGLNRHFSQS